MAAFDDRSWQRLDLQLLQNSAITLYYSAQVLDDDCAWFAANSYLVHRFECDAWKSEEAALVEIGQALEFSEFHGRSLDAFSDWLGDIEIPAEGGRVLVLRHYDAVAARFPRFAPVLLDIIASIARFKLLFGQRLLALVQSDDPRLAFEPVGATAVMWNPREHSNAARGV